MLLLQRVVVFCIPQMILDLDLTDVNPQRTRIRRVAALPDGGAFVNNYVRSNDTNQVWLYISVKGVAFTDCWC